MEDREGPKQGSEHYKSRQYIEEDAIAGVETGPHAEHSAGHEAGVAARGPDLRHLGGRRASQGEIVDQQVALAAVFTQVLPGTDDSDPDVPSSDETETEASEA